MSEKPSDIHFEKLENACSANNAVSILHSYLHMKGLTLVLITCGCMMCNGISTFRANFHNTFFVRNI